MKLINNTSKTLRDDFVQGNAEYLENSGQFDGDSNRLVKNLDSNGRFHTNWLNMLFTRLKMSKDLIWLRFP